MTTYHFQDEDGQPFGTNEAESLDEIAVVVMNTQFGEYHVALNPDREYLVCTCKPEPCEHESAASSVLASTPGIEWKHESGANAAGANPGP